MVTVEKNNRDWGARWWLKEKMGKGRASEGASMMRGASSIDSVCSIWRTTPEN
jgi:hypothetical protein